MRLEDIIERALIANNTWKNKLIKSNSNNNSLQVYKEEFEGNFHKNEAARCTANAYYQNFGRFILKRNTEGFESREKMLTKFRDVLEQEIVKKLNKQEIVYVGLKNYFDDKLVEILDNELRGTGKFEYVPLDESGDCLEKALKKSKLGKFIEEKGSYSQNEIYRVVSCLGYIVTESDVIERARSMELDLDNPENNHAILEKNTVVNWDMVEKLRYVSEGEEKRAFRGKPMHHPRREGEFLKYLSCESEVVSMPEENIHIDTKIVRNQSCIRDSDVVDLDI